MNFINNGYLYICIKISENKMNEYLEKFKGEEREHNDKFGPIQPPLSSYFSYELLEFESFIIADIKRNCESRHYHIVFLTKDYFIESIIESIHYDDNKITCILERYEPMN